MQLQTYTQETEPTNLGGSIFGMIGVEDFGLDTCRWCIGSQHTRCHGSCHKLYDGRGCMCAVCHPEHRRNVLRDRRACGRVYGHSTGGKALPGSTWAKMKRKNVGISIRGQAGLFQDATALSRLPAEERPYGEAQRENAGGRPKQKLLSQSVVAPMLVRWRKVANPYGWDNASWELVKEWREEDGLSWNQIEQVTGRKHSRQGFKLWTSKGVLSRFKEPEVWA